MTSLRTSREVQVYVQRGFIWGLRISLSALFKSDSNYLNVFYGIIVFHIKDFIYIYIYIFYSGKCYFFFNLVSSRVSGLLIAVATFICYLLNLSQLLVHWEKESVVFLRYYEAGFHYVFPVPMETNIDGGKYDANVVYMIYSYLNFRLESL